MQRGEFISDAAAEAGIYRKKGAYWPLGRAQGDSIRAIAAAIGRSPSTVSRELRRKAAPGWSG